MTRVAPRSRSPSPTSCTAAGSARGCSSVSRRTPPRPGIDELVAEVLPQNRAMLRVFDDAGFESGRTLQGGVIEVVLRVSTGGRRRSPTGETTWRSPRR